MKCLNCLNFVTAHTFLGHNQLIVQFTSAAHPNLEFESPTISGCKNEVSTTADMWLQGQIDFFMQPFITVHFPAN